MTAKLGKAHLVSALPSLGLAKFHLEVGGCQAWQVPFGLESVKLGNISSWETCQLWHTLLTLLYSNSPPNFSLSFDANLGKLDCDLDTELGKPAFDLHLVDVDA